MCLQGDEAVAKLSLSVRWQISVSPTFSRVKFEYFAGKTRKMHVFQVVSEQKLGKAKTLDKKTGGKSRTLDRASADTIGSFLRDLSTM